MPHIDWITFSTDENIGVDELRPLLGVPDDYGKTLKHYIRSYDYKCGTLHLSGNDRQGNLVVIGGEAMEHLRQKHDLDKHIVWHVLRLMRNATRVDVALDVNKPVIRSYLQYMEEGKEKRLGAKKVKGHVGFINDPGFTIEIGSRKSAIFYRLYDKAAQLKHDASEIWERIEVEVSDKLRNRTFLETLQKTGTGYTAMLQSGLDFNPEIQAMMDTESKLTVPKRQTSYDVWLQTVATSLEKKIENGEEKEAIQRFSDKLKLLGLG